MKKIALIVESMDKGVGKHVYNLYNYLSNNNNYEVYMLIGSERIEDTYKDIFNNKNNFKIINLREKIGFNDIKAIFEIKKILKEIKPDIVHCHSSKAGLSGRIAAKLCGVKKVIYSPHAYYFLKYKDKSLKKNVFLLAEKFLSKCFTTKTITTSKGEDDAYLQYKIDKKEKRILIEHGIDKVLISNEERTEARKKIGVLENEILIGSMARFTEQKNPLNAFKILDSVSKKYNNVKCIFWGNGPLYDDVKALKEQLNSSVMIPGEVKNPNLCLKSLDIYLTASIYEGLPYTLIESLSQELPIVSSNVLGNKDCVFDNENGFLFDVEDNEAAVKKISELIDKNLLDKFGKNSLKVFEERFSKDKMNENYEKLYLEE